jgi:Fur family ferric uptake transcriptional regulator
MVNGCWLEQKMTSDRATDRHPELRAAEACFRTYLAAHGLKYTRERRAILRAVMQNEEHFEAEELLLAMRDQGQRVAKATIYRALPLLLAAGVVREVIFGEKHAHYEHTFGHRPHDHMICQRCGRIVEFDSKDVVTLIDQLCSHEGFKSLSHRFQITGICQACRSGQSRKGSPRS